MKYFVILVSLLFSTITHAIHLKANAPTRYVIRHGDSLWSIANRYLQNPWEWKELWRANPNITNPNKLYAGDILYLEYTHDRPYIRVLANKTVKLSPYTHPSNSCEAIPTVPLGDIKPFLNESLVLDEPILHRAPYIVAYMGEHMMGGQGDQVYVKGLHPSLEMPTGGTIAYSIFRKGPNYIDPLTNEILGYKASLVGNAELVAGGEPATVLLTSIIQGIQINDKVLVNNSPEFDLYYHPTAPSVPVNGFILDMPGDNADGISQEAIGAVIVINLGKAAGLKPGDVLGIYKKIRVVKDPKNKLIPIELPQERIGEAMIFRAFTKTSFALIVRSSSAIHLLDSVKNP